MASDPESVQLKEPTLQAFAAYVSVAEAVMDRTLHESGLFLWADTAPDRAQSVRAGRIVAQRASGSGSVPVPDGLIHDWIGTVFVPGTTVNETLALVQDYNNHKKIYEPDVIDSALRSRQDNNFQIHLRLRKKKVVTAVLDTDHDVHYFSLDPAHWSCRSYTTRIGQVEDAGSANERVLPPDTGHGFLWRLYSYWRFQESDGGVYIECRAISLTRDIPTGLGWIVRPIIRKLPRESVIHTLHATRQALSSRGSEASPGSSPNCPGASPPEEPQTERGRE